MKTLWGFICILWLLIKLAFVLLERAITGRIINHFKNKELLEIGTQLTFYYFLIFLIFFGGKLSELYNDKTGINGVGDFLAGLFSPIAFGWLIIGYLMQNKELKSSVEQTAEAQRLARDQLEFQKKIKLEQDRIKHNSSQPNFKFIETTGEKDDLKVRFKNLGHSVHNMTIRTNTIILFYGTWENLEEKILDINLSYFKVMPQTKGRKYYSSHVEFIDGNETLRETTLTISTPISPKTLKIVAAFRTTLLIDVATNNGN